MDGEVLALVGLLGLAAFLATRRSDAAPLFTSSGIVLPGYDGEAGYVIDYPSGSGFDYSASPATDYAAPWTRPAGESDPYSGAYDYEIGGDVTTPSDTLWSPPASAAPYLQTITAAETKYDIPPMLLARLLYQESRFRPDIISGAVKSSAGAIGIAQFMPATAADLGVNAYNPTDSIFAAAKYLRSLYNQVGSWSLALAAYNWGIGNVLRKGMSAAPLETQNYVAQITADVGVA